MPKISTVLQENIDEFNALCADCDDIIRRTMRLGKETKVDCFMAYVEVAVSNMILEDSVLGRLLNHMWEMPREEIYEYIEQNGLGISDVREFPTMEEAMAAMLAGNAILFVDGYDKAFKISSKGYPGLGVPKAEAEKVLRGSQEAFTDSVKVNTALIRKRVQDTRLKVKEKQIGVRSNTMTSLVYVDDLVYPELVESIQKKIDEIDIDGILDTGIIEQLTEPEWYSPFPQFQVTERPDKAAMAVLDGRVVLAVNNSPSVLILPTNFNSFFQTSDDYFNRFEIVSFIRILRYIAAFLAVALPGLYLAVTEFHTQILPTELVLSFAAARKGVPFSGLVELLIMEISFELLREAGVRMPGVIGSTIGIVGGLIVGQAAVNANLVSPIVVIVVALTALSSFSIPNEEFSTAFRLFKFMLIFLSAWLGLYGFVMGMLLVLIHLAQLKSFGIPYLMPFVGADLNSYMDERDSIIRWPIFKMKRRPIFAKRNSRIRFREKTAPEAMKEKN